MSDAPESEVLRDVLDYYDRWLAFNQHYRRIPGVQAAVFAGDGVAFSGAYGLADVENAVPLTDDHLFRIASHSKTFTATALLQLVEQGRLRLDDKAGQHVTELVGTPLGERTIRDLLAHAGGVTRDGLDSVFWQLDRTFPNRDELLEVLRVESTVVIPDGERFKYSNIGYSLLGLVIESVTGTPYNAHVRSAIVDKLGLANLGPELDPDRLTEYAAGYSALSYADQRVPIEHVNTHAMASATGFFGNARDLVTYFSAHLPGDDRLLTDRSKREMQHPLWPEGPEDWPRYGLGLGIEKSGERRLYGHGGGYPGHITRSLADGSAGVVVSVLTNAIDGPAAQLATAFFKLLDLAESKERPAQTADLSRFTGRYAYLWGVVDIVELNGRLYYLDPVRDDPANLPTRLEADGDTLLVADDSGSGAYGERYRFTFGPDGKPESVVAAIGMRLTPIDRFALPSRLTVG